MNPSKLLSYAAALALPGLLLFFACTKNPVTPPPIHDTVTVIKHDTTTLPQAVDSTVNIKKGLVLYLPFTGSFADSSGFGNTVTAVNGASLAYDMHGYANGAFNATGAGERLIVSNNGAYKVDTAFSVSCDFMIRDNAYYSGGYDFTGLQVFLSIVNVAAGTGPTFNFGLTRPDAPQYFTFGVNGQAADCSGYGNNNPSSIGDTTKFIPQIGSWYNVVCTYRKGSSSVYINGQLIRTETNPNNSSVVFCPDANFVVGGWWNAGASGVENIRGKLDEVRFYNRVLNPHEITWLARNFQPGSVRQLPGLKTH